MAALGDFGRLPERLEFGRLSSPARCPCWPPGLDAAKAPLEFGVGRPQRGLGIDFQMARQVDDREQEVAQLQLALGRG